MPLGIPSFPWPARPPMPRISPSFTSRLTLRTVSPGISTQSFSIFRMVLLSSTEETAADTEGASFTSRPTIHRVISSTLVSDAGTSFTRTPSRMTATLLQTARISCRRWVMKITAIPRADMPRMDSRSASASCSVRTAVGSSRIRSFSWSLESSLAISVNCLCPTGMLLMVM